jgi:hypothetical protein
MKYVDVLQLIGKQIQDGGWPLVRIEELFSRYVVPAFTYGLGLLPIPRVCLS